LNEKPASVTYLKSVDVARMCQVDPKTVHKWVDTGSLKHFRTPGGHRRFHRDDVLEFMRRIGFLRSWETLPEAKST
jgi:excisionase family DNA binding protein